MHSETAALMWSVTKREKWNLDELLSFCPENQEHIRVSFCIYMLTYPRLHQQTEQPFDSMYLFMLEEAEPY